MADTKDLEHNPHGREVATAKKISQLWVESFRAVVHHNGWEHGNEGIAFQTETVVSDV